MEYHENLKSSLAKWRLFKKHVQKGRSISYDFSFCLQRTGYWSKYIWILCGFCKEFIACEACPLSEAWCNSILNDNEFLGKLKFAFCINGDLKKSVKMIDEFIAHMKTLNHEFYEDRA